MLSVFDHLFAAHNTYYKNITYAYTPTHFACTAQI
jgi:hypothetical protein